MAFTLETVYVLNWPCDPWVFVKYLTRFFATLLYFIVSSDRMSVVLPLKKISISGFSSKKAIMF